MLLCCVKLRNHLAKGPLIDFGYKLEQGVEVSVPDAIAYKFLDKYPDLVERRKGRSNPISKPRTEMKKELTKYRNKLKGRYKDKSDGSE